VLDTSERVLLEYARVGVVFMVMCLLGDDRAHFLTNNCRINVLTFGIAFNLGEFFVTPLTYLHPLLQNVKMGKPAGLLGPPFSALHSRQLVRRSLMRATVKLMLACLREQCC